MAALAVRTVLSAPLTREGNKIQSKAILAVSILSAVGAAWMIVSFMVFKALRSFRHQLILGLAISDFCMAANFCLSTGLNVSGRMIGDPAQDKVCSFNGFMTQVFVIQTDYWVLTIAACTFLILANYRKQSMWIQDHRIYLWCIPWVFSSLWAGLGLGLAGYDDIGAWCWFTSDKVRLLVNFLPRWVIIAIILCIYTRLYFIIYRAHSRFSELDAEVAADIGTGSGALEGTLRSSTELLDSGGSKPATVGEGASVGQGENVDVARGSVAKPNSELKRIAGKMMIYPLVYMLIWVIPTSIRIYQSVSGQSAPLAVATVDKACIVVQGFADAIVYGVNESSLAAWRDRFSRR
ncbi:G protein-coupled glucose receptor regulating Gpa2-domain-containing protein [Lineolata rhizophorae]|uniref:G protein-coupled glucose receptor regulating Gpa2-domain-containing protein n=1 Tax=Lineolata rhizophorae TaxID=578093 RepID=A0A6A6PCN8_9PEZI|nr:G protein-coupled glucose receptor regulating Gpa2-domain-containing protein [Lineolata rhizophorae]